MRVLFVGGAGRSGSTLLDLILGNLPGFFSIGEVRYFWEYLVQSDTVCGCGADLVDCEFWKSVWTDLVSRQGVDLTRMADLSERLNRSRNLFRMVGGAPAGASAEWEELVAGTGALYHGISSVLEGETLVDTSKVPSQLILLRRASGIDLRVLHLVRDGRAVAYSWSRRRKKDPGVSGGRGHMPDRSASRAMVTWVAENVFILKLRGSIPMTTLRYEDFTKDPHGELGRTLASLGFQDVDLSLLLESSLALSSTHSVGGNPIRFSRDRVSIAPDAEWHRAMPRWQRVSLGLLGLPMLRYFGYRL